MAAPSSVTRWSPYARKYGSKYGVPANVLLGLIQIESGGRPGLTSSAGAQGLTQFMPGTARQYKVNINDPASSIRGAAQYLHDLGYSQNPTKALASYNAGPGNYGAGIGYARNVLGAAGSYKGATGAGPLPSYTPTSTGPGLPDPSTGSALAQALSRPQSSVSPPMAPAFAAKVATPQTYQAPPGVTGTNNSQGDLRQTLADILRSDAPPQYQPGSPPVTSGGSGAAAPRLPGVGTNYGRVIVAPGANRAGVGLQKPVLGFVKEVAGIFGKPIQITTGTNHNQYVVNTTRQSDHWTGNAVDIAVPVDGVRGDEIAASALEAAGVSQKKAQQMAHQGGLYNLNVNGRRLQVIWKTNEGGNHHNHVHIGYR